jgi:hypothetical protein
MYVFYAESGHYLISLRNEGTDMPAGIAVYRGDYYYIGDIDTCNNNFIMAAALGNDSVLVEVVGWEYYTIVIFGMSPLSTGNVSLYISTGYEGNQLVHFFFFFLFVFCFVPL